MSTSRKLSSKPGSINQEDISKFFNTLRANIDAQERAIITGTASKEEVAFVENSVKGNDDAMMQSIRSALNIRFIEAMMEQYLDYLGNMEKLPLRLAFAFGPTTVLVWAEVEDDDEKMILDLLLAEANLVPKFSQQGAYMKTMAVEKSEERKVPKGYIEFPLHKAKNHK